MMNLFTAIVAKPACTLCCYLSPLLLAALMLGGCATSSDPDLQYYTLYSAPTEPQRVLNGKQTEAIVLLSSVDIADYLKPSQLPVMIGEHQVHYSNYHLWAQPLKADLVNALLYDLNKLDDATYLKHLFKPQKAQVHLSVTIEHFVITADARAILSGTYRLSQADKEIPAKEQHFVLSEDLDADGFAEGVKTQRQLVQQLSEQIVKDIEELRSE